MSSPGAQHELVEYRNPCKALRKDGGACRSRALIGTDRCVVHTNPQIDSAQIAPASTSRRCSANTHAGEPCKMPAIRGGTVCLVHGGNSALAQKTAKLRLLALVEPALDALHYAMEQAKIDRDWANVIKAALGLLDRSGHGTHSTITLQEEATPLEDMSEADMARLAGELQEELASRAKDVTPERTH